MWDNLQSDNKSMVMGAAIVIVSNLACAEPEYYELDMFEPMYQRYQANAIDNGVYKSRVNEEVDDVTIESDILSFEFAIRNVRESLGLPKNDIAKIFKVSRQTLHSYLNGVGENQTLNSQTVARVKAVAALNDKISEILSSSPGAMAKNYFVDGESLFSLLIKGELNENRIIDLARALAARNTTGNVSSEINIGTLYDLTTTV